jgi:hypothetical protein
MTAVRLEHRGLDPWAGAGYADRPAVGEPVAGHDHADPYGTVGLRRATG